MKFFTRLMAIFFATSITSLSFGQALSFDGVDDYVEILNTSNTVLNDFSVPHDFTVEIRFSYPTGANIASRTIVSNEGPFAGFYIVLDPNGKITGAYGTPNLGWGASMFKGSSPINYDTWYVATLTYDHSTTDFIVYIDGVSVGSSNLQNLMGLYGFPPEWADYVASGNDFRIGDRHYQSGINSEFHVDYFRVWSEVRSPADIAANQHVEVDCASSNLLVQYKMDDGVAGGNNGAITSISDCTTNNYDGGLVNFTMNGSNSNFTNPILPVELTTFEGFAQRKSNILNWSTSTEENNEGFYIERSLDGENWEIIDFVEGFGTTYETQYYQYEDQSPYNGKSYYRLKQMDFDGQFEYSNIISIENTDQNTNIKLFPNPVVDKLMINSDSDDIEAIIIFNAMGQPVLQQNTINNQQFEVDTNDLPKGIYTLQLQKTNGMMITKQFVK